MSTDREQHDELPFEEALLKNIERLRDDAMLLAQNGRYASSTALSIVGLEEAGKLAIEYWKGAGYEPEITKKRSAHIAKQYVIFALLCAGVAKAHIVAELKKQFSEVADEYIAGRGTFSEQGIVKIRKYSQEQIESVAKIFCESTESKNWRYSDIGVFQEIKHICLYVDKKSKTGIRFTTASSESAEYHLDLLVRSMEILRDKVSLDVARAVLETPKRGGFRKRNTR